MLKKQRISRCLRKKNNNKKKLKNLNIIKLQKERQKMQKRLSKKYKDQLKELFRMK